MKIAKLKSTLAILAMVVLLLMIMQATASACPT